MRNTPAGYAAILGFASVSIFVVAFVVFSFLNPDFNFLSDHISKLGADGQPHALYWNAIGFGCVGLCMAGFGWFFGVASNDKLLGICLLVAGVGFAVAATPTDFSHPDSALSKVHYASICISLGGLCFGLARLTGSGVKDHFSKVTANGTVVLALLPMLCIGGGVSAEPVAHRIVLAVVFAWIAINSVRLLQSTPLKPMPRS